MSTELVQFQMLHLEKESNAIYLFLSKKSDPFLKFYFAISKKEGIKKLLFMGRIENFR